MGTNIESLWKYPDERKRLMEEVRTRDAVSNYPATLIAKNGREVEISLSLSQLKDDQGRVLGTVGISKNVTEENRLRNQLIEQERLAAVGQTVAGVTHCMKNVLNGLKGGAYLVNVGLKRNDSGMLEEGWENVQAGINRISKLSLDMLSYCRDRKPDHRPTDPLGLANDTVALVSESARQEGIELTCEGKDGLIVELDPEAVGRALLNLITNALDACREKTYQQNESARVEVVVTRDDNHVYFEVKDNGIGMDAATREKLFTRFFSTKDAGGTGLGLCVTQKIAEEHGGTIQVKSRPGKGSAFILTLPVEPPSGQAGETSKQ
jgi:signal transduction histidine kinase